MYPVTLVSLGPGDPELITLKGLRTLQEADCIFCPETGTRPGASACSRAAHILAQLHIPDNKIERFHLPMSKDRQQAMAAYDQAFLQIRTLCADNRRICIVAEGDAGLYASIHYIYDRLHSEGYPVEQIPGIPAFIASGARAGLHLVSQQQRLTVIPGLATTEDIEQLLGEGGTVVIMKLSQCTDEIHRCIRLHPEYTYQYFENVGTEQERLLTDPQALANLRFPYFSLMIIMANR